MKAVSYGTTEPLYQQDDILLTAAERDLLQADRPGYGSRSKMDSAFNLVNSTVGAGIIGLPFAIYLAGFWTAIALSVFVCIISQLGLHMLVVSGQRSGCYKFAVLMEYVMGKTGFYFLNFLILVQASGACVSYYIRKSTRITSLRFIESQILFLSSHWRYNSGFIAIVLSPHFCLQ